MALFTAALAGCATNAPPPQLPEARRPSAPDAYPNWSVSPELLDGWARADEQARRARELEIRFAKGAGAGVTGAYQATVFIVPEPGAPGRRPPDIYPL